MQYCSALCHASEFDPGPVEVRLCINTGEHTSYKPLNAAEVKEKKKEGCVQNPLIIRARVVQNIQRFSWLQTKQKDLVYIIFGRVAGV